MRQSDHHIGPRRQPFIGATHDEAPMPLADLNESTSARPVLSREAIPFGLYEGRLFEPLRMEGRDGLGHDFVCPGCRAPVVVRTAASDSKPPYFTHKLKSGCRTGAEKAVHLAAKQLITERMAIVLPNQEDKPCREVSWLPERISVGPWNTDGPVRVEQVHITRPKRGMSTCLTVKTPGLTVLVKLAVTHTSSSTAVSELKRLPSPVVEFDFSDVQDFTLEALESRLFKPSDRSRWLQHPAELVARTRAKEWLSHVVTLSYTKQGREAKTLPSRENTLERTRQELARQTLGAAQINDLGGGAGFKALAPSEQLALVCQEVGAEPGPLPPFVGIEVRGRHAIAAPVDTWQAALCAQLFQPTVRTRPLIVNPQMVHSWLEQRFHTKYRKAFPILPVLDYLKATESMGILARVNSRDFMVAVAGWSAASEVSHECMNPYVYRHVWNDSWPDRLTASAVATAFRHRHKASLQWQRIASLRPAIREYKTPYEVAVTYEDLAHVDPALVLLFLLSAGFTKLA